MLNPFSSRDLTISVLIPNSLKVFNFLVLSHVLLQKSRKAREAIFYLLNRSAVYLLFAFYINNTDIRHTEINNLPMYKYPMLRACEPIHDRQLQTWSLIVYTCFR